MNYPVLMYISLSCQVHKILFLLQKFKFGDESESGSASDDEQVTGTGFYVF
jgi:hypothetical protein